MFGVILILSLKILPTKHFQQHHIILNLLGNIINFISQWTAGNMYLHKPDCARARGPLFTLCHRALSETLAEIAENAKIHISSPGGFRGPNLCMQEFFGMLYRMVPVRRFYDILNLRY